MTPPLAWGQSEHERDLRNALPLLEHENTARKCCEQGGSSSRTSSPKTFVLHFSPSRTLADVFVIYKPLSLWELVVATSGLSMTAMGLYVRYGL